ncbi:winged helix-turn-helix domain-containing protein [Stenotrophomonas maltophilia]|uniref:ArsR/SmtB family transcription factor n=1 Tax=Stenotrophomonas TaxID=40323 RepID=UPI00066AC9CB|nr:MULTISPECIES: winged helix-turn-helix domain-containing protein [Stenotrophomonas]MBN4994891.1 winged helix-turn-helix transcriptional regulator [Stenotrophomonas maltophilia]MCO7498739.1 winged helix-turn-helix domain-containing protein [Stenotrophomonas maltophilia]MDV3511510.1 winged helix-turn-helix domain-containing protein [Stenotrophomonas sp. C4297]OHY67792.1 transcriptional regulator [Stenotrophomonas maltophilia]QBL40304.1 ArsR family transcriptional regulator [Stenotrophomonas sp
MVHTSGSLVSVGALVGDQARASMLLQLMDGRAYTATELARVAGVTPQTASTHLRRLVEGDLLVAVAQGRHRYHRLASHEVADMLEGILRVADRTPSCTAEASRSMPALRQARSCYRHLAGVHAVAITDRLLQAGHLVPHQAHWRVSVEGAAFLQELGQPLAELLRLPVTVKPARYCRGCLDCTERRPHLAGLVGEAMLDSFVKNDWLRRVEGRRELRLTQPGREALWTRFGLAT